MTHWRRIRSSTLEVRSHRQPWGTPLAVACCAAMSTFGCNDRGVDSRDDAPAAAALAIEAVQPTLTDDAKQALILDVLERFVPHAEAYWRTSDLSEPLTGRYDAVGSGVTQPRGAGDIAFAYVTLLGARPDQAAFGGVTREVMIDHTIQSIRHEALTNKLSGKTYNRWGGGSWQASLETYSWAFAAHRLWDRLDEETRTLVQRVLTGEANILITKAIASGEEGDTGAEDNAWNSPTPALAAMMFPGDSNAANWEYTAKRLALNASSLTVDATDTSLVDGVPLNQWMASVNLHPDMTMENHGFFNPIYQQVTHVDINDAAIAFGAFGRSLPEAFSFRTADIWDNVLSRLASDEGDFVMPAGQDWTSKDFQHLDYLGIVASRLRRADASVYESRALRLVAQRQATHVDGSMLGQTQIGYETMLIKRLAALWWTHELFGPSPAPTDADFASARAAVQGVKVYPYSDFIAAQLGQAFVSMSWDPAKPMGLVVPRSDAFASDPMFTYYAPNSLVGAASGTIGEHSCDCRSDQFSTAGFIGTRRFSMTGFSDGVTLLLDRGTGSTFTYSLEDIAGVTGARPIWSSAGDILGTLSGNWVNAADRVGMIVLGGSGITANKVTGSNNQLVITGSADTGSGNRAALILPNVGHERTMQLEPYAKQLTTPAEWSAASARVSDESLRVAVARWAGLPLVDLELTDDRGAPVPVQDATVEGHTAHFTAQLEAPASEGQTIRFFVDSANSLRAQQQNENAAVIRNPGESDATIDVTYVSAAGVAEAKQRVLADGEQVIARTLGGALTLAGPELESLVAARTELVALSNDLPDDECSSHNRLSFGCWRGHRHHIDGFAELIGDALTAVDAAIARAQAVDPNERQLAWAIQRALRLVDRLEHHPGCLHLTPEAKKSLRLAVDSIESRLREAAAQVHSVSVWALANDLAQPGEILPLQIEVVNRSLRHVRNGTVTVTGPEGWGSVGPLSAFDSLEPNSSTTIVTEIRVPSSAAMGDAVALAVELDYDKGHRDGMSLTSLDLVVAPVIDLTVGASRIPVALRATNVLPLELSNLSDHPIDVNLTSLLPAGITIANTNLAFNLAASSSIDIPLLVRNQSNVTGTGQVSLIATTAAGAEVSSTFALNYTDDLVLNTVGAPWPAISATSNQSAYPPRLASDGSASTFWVSGGTVAGEGPTPTNPIWLMVDFGTPENIGTVVMVPRVGYGPKAYTIQISDDATTWQQVAAIPSASNSTVTTNLGSVSARYLRLVMTAGWDRIQPPRNVQIISLNVKAPVI